MSRSLIRKNQLHPDIADLVSGYGTDFFITPTQLATTGELLSTNIATTGALLSTNIATTGALLSTNIATTGSILQNQINNLSGSVANVDLSSAVRLTGNQTISGIKNFASRPTVNGTGVLTFADTGNFNITVTALLTGENIVYTTGDQTISGNKDFTSVPTVNGIPLSTGSNGGTSEYVFTSDLNVSLSPGKTFGRYLNGDTILASGKTTSEVLRLALVEPITPTVSLVISSPSISFNQTNISNTLNASTIIRSSNANVETGYLEWRRSGVGNVGPWVQLTGNTLASFSFTHSLSDTNFNTSGFNYRYIVKDTAGASGSGITGVNPQSYSAPTLSSTNVGSTTALLGSAKNTNLSGIINRQSSLVPLTGYQLQYSTGTPTTWIDIGGRSGIAGNPNSFSFSIPHINNNLVNTTSISYQTIIYDTFTNTSRPLGSKTFLYERYLGYNTGEFLTGINEIESLVSGSLSDLRTGLFPKVTTPSTQHFTYYAYRSGAGPISTIVQDGSTTIYTSALGGAFVEQNGITGLNKSGANVFYRVYKSIDRGAFTTNDLEFR